MTLNKDRLDALLHKNLDQYPSISKFLGPLLKNRMRQDEPLLCWPIRMLVLEQRERAVVTKLENQLQFIDRFVTNPQAIFRGLSGKEPDFDQKVLDLQAEIHALQYIARREGCTCGEKIHPIPNRQVPDFWVAKDGEMSILEVKNVRALETFHYLFSHLHAKSIVPPSLYDRWRFEVYASCPIDVERTRWKDIQAELDNLLSRIAAQLEGPQSANLVVHSQAGLNLHVEITWSPADHFEFSSVMSRPTEDIQDPTRNYLSPLVRKTLDKIQEARSQIEEYRSDHANVVASHIAICGDLMHRLPPLSSTTLCQALRQYIDGKWLNGMTKIWIIAYGDNVCEFRRASP